MRDFIKLCVENLIDDRGKISAFEGPLQRAQLLQDAAECPHIRFVRVFLAPTYLRRQLLGGAHGGLGHVRRLVQQLSDAEVT